ncbi:hypothetical protein DOY81_008260 [Sarcophaga bullata]|nr:hypothetical protein DOY81_008260 [Sarcophaga bullata]
MIQSGYQVMVKCNATQRPSLANIWKEVFPLNEPRAKSLIGISGSAGTGKRLALYQLITRAAVTECVGGKYSQVILLDLVHKFDMSSLEDCIKRFIEKENPVASPQLSSECAITKYTETILHLPCYSLDQFELAFEEIDDLLWDHKNVALLAIDGLETFYWEDCRYQLQRMTTHYKKLVQRLKQLCETHNIYCVYTADASYLSKMNAFLPQTSIDYRIKIIQNADGGRFLNNLPIEINEAGGIEFLMKK